MLTLQYLCAMIYSSTSSVYSNQCSFIIMIICHTCHNAILGRGSVNKWNVQSIWSAKWQQHPAELFIDLEGPCFVIFLPLLTKENGCCAQSHLSLLTKSWEDKSKLTSFQKCITILSMCRKRSFLTCKVKPGVQKTCRHVETRLTTGVNTHLQLQEKCYHRQKCSKLFKKKCSDLFWTCVVFSGTI